MTPSSECKEKQKSANRVAPPGECNANNSRKDGSNLHARAEADEATLSRGRVHCKGSGEGMSAQYRRLWEVDPETASRLHPSNRRKIAR